MDIKEKVEFPDSPGVYLMKGKKGRLLYVGKACSLKKRVSSYFQKPPTAKIQRLLGQVRQIDYIQTHSAAQALLLENALIKRYKPYYNAALKDDKSYPFIKISAREKYPCLLITRGKKEKGALLRQGFGGQSAEALAQADARYYGPYTNVKLLKSAIKTIRAIFPFRSCRRLPKKPCLYLHLKLCPGMCAKEIDQRLYRENLRQLELFLQGQHQKLLKELKAKMLQVAGDEKFEQAADLRNKINSLSDIISQTKEPKYSLAFARDDSKNGKYVESQDLIVELQKVLKLAKAPQRIEAFDISEISGFGLCGSMVSFLDGWPEKKYYRKFKIKTVSGIDDYAMMREVLRRRYGPQKAKNMPPVPDLVMIDGGKGHLSCALRELESVGLGGLAVISLAKRLETIYTSCGKTLNLPGNSKLLHLLQRIRDEAHRFAISYHRKLRQKQMCLSSLDGIGGVGPKKKRALLRHFGSVAEIKRASLEDLLRVKGIDSKAAENVIRFFGAKSF